PRLAQPCPAGEIQQLGGGEGAQDGDRPVVASESVAAPDGRRKEPGAEVGRAAALELAGEDGGARGARQLAERGEDVVRVEVVRRKGEERDIERAVGEWERTDVGQGEGDLGEACRLPARDL